MSARTLISLVVVPVLGLWSASLQAELRIGTASANITPDEPVAVSGQFHLRIARTVESPVTANVLALESRRDGQPQDGAVLVSCDLLYIPANVLARVREAVGRRVANLEPVKIIISGTHTHTAPVLIAGKYPIPKQGVIQVDQYHALLAQRLADAIEKAWKSRAPASVSWGLGHAVVAYNRRTVYRDGTAQMYGAMDVPQLLGLEGFEDHDVGSLFAWNAAGAVIAMAVNVACPAQEVESRSTVNADFWHPVREALRARHGANLCVLGWPGAAGDQSPHLMYRKAADERMRRLRGLSRLEEIARRLEHAVEETYDAVQNDRHADIPLVHKVETLHLPMRLVTQPEYEEAKAEIAKATAQITEDPSSADRLWRKREWFVETVRRFEQQRTELNPTCEMELHVLRLGDIAVCTNPFELFTEYGLRIKARSKALQTFVIQLAGPGTYLPTAKAVRGGGYSAVVHSSLVGPEGGQMLVDRTVELINSLWAERK